MFLRVSKNLRKSFLVKRSTHRGRSNNNKILSRRVGKLSFKNFLYKVSFKESLVHLNYVVVRVLNSNSYLKIVLVKSVGGDVCVSASLDDHYIGVFQNNNKYKLYCNLWETPFGSKIAWVFYNHVLLGSAYKSFCRLLYFLGNKFIIILPSGYIKLINRKTTCITSNYTIFCKKKIIPGYRSCLLRGKRSVVRGVAKNPNDHPNGGRTKSLRFYKTPWGDKVIKKK